jgi:hypothetical protein
MATFSESLFGSKGRYEQLPSQYNPQQQQILNQLLQQGAQGLGTDAIEGQARRNYKANVLPLLSQRFRAGQSGANNALQESGSLLEGNLAALRQGNAMNLLNLGLQNQQGYEYVPGQEGFINPTTIGAAGDLAGAYFGVPGAGTRIMSLFKSLFGNQGQGGSGSGTMQANRPTSYFGNQGRMGSGMGMQQNNPLQQLLGQSNQFNPSLLNQGFGGQQQLLGQSITGGLNRLATSGNRLI